MASCTRIDGMLQAFVDGEISHSDRIIVRQHVSECNHCRQVVKNYQQTSAILLETFAPARLSHDMVAKTLDHLPEMETPAVDMDVLNRRAKHPAPLRERAGRLVPIGAAVLLLVLAAIINNNWPYDSLTTDTIGVVTQSHGEVYRVGRDEGTREAIGVKAFAGYGERFETNAGATMMLTLAGPTDIVIGANSRVLVHNERRISVEKGHVYLDVASANELFKVFTPSGDITVFGTQFDVMVDADRTTVIVEEGEVQLSHVEHENVFGILEPGQLGSIGATDRTIRPRKVDARQATQWAHAIVPDEEAQALFSQHILSLQDTAEVAGREMYFIDTLDRPLKSILVEWEQTTSNLRYASYDVFVYDDQIQALFRGRIDGSVFSDPNVTQYEVKYIEKQNTKRSHVFVKLVPEDGGLKREANITSLDARVGK